MMNILQRKLCDTRFFIKKLTGLCVCLIAVTFLSCSDDPIVLPTPIQQILLPPEMNEISGILNNNNNTIIAHNDSGDEPNIYEISLTEQKINRTISVSNAEALDWEDIAEDEEHIYIGDFGNNLGSRENLVIYKIVKNAVAIQDSINAESISFYYPEQTNFTLRNDHNFDCEAMIVLENEIFLFTKNRTNFKTDWYALPTSSGDYPALFKSSFDTKGLITGATISPNQDVIALLGYSDLNTNATSFIWLLYDFPSDNIFNGKQRKIELSIEEQTEAIAFQNNITLLFAEEKESGNEGGFVYSLDIEPYLRD